MPGKVGNLAQKALDQVNNFTGELGISHVGESSVEENRAKKEALDSPQTVSNKTVLESTTRNNVAIDINDPGGNVKDAKQTRGNLDIPVKVTPTNGQR